MNSLTRKWIVALAIIATSCQSFAITIARGLVVYTEPPQTYVETLEFVSLTNINTVIATAVLPTGAKQELSRRGIIAIVDYPPATPTASLPQDAAAAFRNIQALRSKYPQFATRLNGAETRWNNSLETFRQAQHLIKTTPVPSQKSIRLEVDGAVYEQVVLTSFDGSTVGVAHASGVAGIPAIKLKPEQIAALNATSKSVQIDRLKDDAKPAAHPISGNFALTLEAHRDGKNLGGTDYYFFKSTGQVIILRIATLNGLALPAQRHVGTYVLKEKILRLHVASENGTESDWDFAVATDGTVRNSDGLKWERTADDIDPDRLSEEQNRKFLEQAAIAAGLAAGKRHAQSGRPLPTEQEIEHFAEEYFAVADPRFPHAADSVQLRDLKNLFSIGVYKGYLKGQNPAGTAPVVNSDDLPASPAGRKPSGVESKDWTTPTDFALVLQSGQKAGFLPANYVDWTSAEKVEAYHAITGIVAIARQLWYTRGMDINESLDSVIKLIPGIENIGVREAKKLVIEIDATRSTLEMRPAEFLTAFERTLKVFRERGYGAPAAVPFSLDSMIQGKVVSDLSRGK